MTTESRTGPGPRDRFRAQVREEVKAAALRQLADGGPEALSLNAVAKQLGMTGPALYRYFANRDSLLTELVVDAYETLAATLARAAGTPAGDGAERLAAVVRAYRDWARTEPHRYRLLFRAPFKGYDAHSTRLVDAAQRAMNVVLNVANALTSPDAAVPEDSRDQVQEWMKRRGVEDVPPAVASRTVLLWAHLHGLASLEIEDNFASMGIDPGPLYEAAAGEFTHGV
ncbi:TetR/AcrR family transcriptional regulator [Streptomyces sp. NBC_01176]|uniref:TetR/AcrR family transcriptional regulator n=1 Tax=Streptomyces sp. NBC_01176 TaxID=2903760 RepID=UPI00386F30F3|nr:TetR/AcrR family transcriptional regulator [Streptomyces sp. NBC_01176]